MDVKSLLSLPQTLVGTVLLKIMFRYTGMLWSKGVEPAARFVKCTTVHTVD